MGHQASKSRVGHSWSSPLSAPLELINQSMVSDNDIIGNLRWSLTESMRWQERAVTVKDIICVEGLHEANNLSKSQQEERYLATLELLDDVLNYSSHTKSTPTTTSAFSSATKTKESVKSSFTANSSEQQQATQQQSSYPSASAGSLKDQPSTSKSPPSLGVQGYATTLLPPSSTKLFAAAACKFVISSVSHGSSTRERSSWFGGERGSKVSQAMSPIQKTIASELQTGASFEGIAGRGISQQVIGVSTGGELQMDSQPSHGTMLAFPHDNIVEHYHSESMYERVEIACKYIYLLSLMKSISHSTVWCYQLHEKIKWFNDCINDSTASVAKGNRHQYSELRKKQMELAKDRVYLLLQDGLKSHDRWRCVLRFGFRDFELCMARHKLQTECARWQYCRDNSQTKQALVWKVNEIDEKLNTLNAQKQALDLEVEKNERDALSCGLAFLDKNLSGSLEAEETPELNAKLFRLLDIQHRAAISYSDLHHGVLSIQEKLENITARIQVLQQQNEQSRQRSSYSSYPSMETSSIASDTGANSALVIQNEFEIQKLKRASIEHWNNLQQIYSVFFNAFAQSVFPSVELNEVDQIQNQAFANGDAIVQIIDHISNMSLTNPLISMQTKLQRGDVSLTSQAALDASIIAESQQIPALAALEAAQTTPLTTPIAFSTTPATQQHSLPTAPIGGEKGITDGYSQQKEARFSAASSLMKSTERSDMTPQSTNRQSQSWMESDKNTAWNITGGSQTNTR